MHPRLQTGRRQESLGEEPLEFTLAYQAAGFGFSASHSVGIIGSGHRFGRHRLAPFGFVQPHEPSFTRVRFEVN
jgi:hypothetical protein